jgi:FAD/FMN-containing dehydrogenase
MDSEIISRLKEAVGSDYVITDEEKARPFLIDWTKRFRGRAVVVRPGSTEEVSRVMVVAYDTRTPVVPQSGGTTLVGGSIPDDSGRAILLSLGRMNRIEEIDTGNDTVTVEAGLILEQLHRAVEEKGRFFPLSFGAQGSAQIGGALATNAGGTAVLRYGNMRDLCLGLEVVLPDGRVMTALRGLRKDNTGYDLKQLFIGSEGTLGVITRAVLKLFPIPRGRQTALVGIPDLESSVKLLDRVKAAAGSELTGFELIQRKCIERVAEQLPGVELPGPVDDCPWWILAELSSLAQEGASLEAILAEAFEAGEVANAYLAQSLSDSEAFWRIRESIPEADASVGNNLHNDVSLKISLIPEFLEVTVKRLYDAYPWLDPSLYGHLGDGNILFNIGSIPSNLAFENEEGIRRITYEEVVKRNGSISAEHGIGQLKRGHFLALKDPLELEIMERISRAIDPRGIMNPGKLLADRKD